LDVKVKHSVLYGIMKRPADIKEPPKMLDSSEEGDTWEDLELYG
jgi:hypothetical protein